MSKPTVEEVLGHILEMRAQTVEKEGEPIAITFAKGVVKSYDEKAKSGHIDLEDRVGGALAKITLLYLEEMASPERNEGKAEAYSTAGDLIYEALNGEDNLA